MRTREKRDGRKVNASCTPWENKPDYQHNYAQITVQRTGRFSDLIKLKVLRPLRASHTQTAEHTDFTAKRGGKQQIDAYAHLTEAECVWLVIIGQFLVSKRRNEISACSFVALIIWPVII
jgi:hypothetical protein